MSRPPCETELCDIDDVLAPAAHSYGERMVDMAQDPHIQRLQQAEQLGHRMIEGAELPPRADGFALLGMDIDDEAGIATVWLAHNDYSYQGDYERDAAGEWQHLGGGAGPTNPDMAGPRPRASGDGAPLLFPIGGTGATRSRRDRQHGDRPPSMPDMDSVGFVASFALQAADTVAHILVGQRRITVPDTGRVVVVWKAPPSQHGPVGRPLVIAFDAHDRQLTELEPLSPFDNAALLPLIGPEPEQA